MGIVHLFYEEYTLSEIMVLYHNWRGLSSSLSNANEAFCGCNILISLESGSSICDEHAFPSMARPSSTPVWVPLQHSRALPNFPQWVPMNSNSLLELTVSQQHMTQSPTALTPSSLGFCEPTFAGFSSYFSGFLLQVLLLPFLFLFISKHSSSLGLSLGPTSNTSQGTPI